MRHVCVCVGGGGGGQQRGGTFLISVYPQLGNSLQVTCCFTKPTADTKPLIKNYKAVNVPHHQNAHLDYTVESTYLELGLLQKQDEQQLFNSLPNHFQNVFCGMG